MQGDGGKLRGNGFFHTSGELVDPNVAEAPEGQLWLVSLQTVSAGIMVLRFGAAVIGRIEIPLFIHDFGERQIQDFTDAAFQCGFHIAGDVLAEVDNGLSLRRGEHAGTGNAFLFSDFFSLLWNQCVRGAFKDQDIAVENWFKSGVIDFSVINLGETNSALGNFPAFVGGYDFLTAVLIGEGQPGQ